MATDKEKQKEKDKVTPIQSVLPVSVFGLVGKVGSGTMGMKEAKEELRRWVAGLTDEEKDQLKADSDRIGRTLVLSAEGLAQELSTLVASL